MRPEYRVSIWFCTAVRDVRYSDAMQMGSMELRSCWRCSEKNSDQCSAMLKLSAQLASSEVAPESLNPVAEVPSSDLTAGFHWLKHHH